MLEGLKMEDLVVVCPKCQGSGDPDNPGYPATIAELGAKPSSTGQICECDRNSGAKDLTEAGRTLLGFVQWLKRTGQLGFS